MPYFGIVGRVPAPEELSSGQISPVPQHQAAGRFVLDCLFPEGLSLRSELDGAPLFEGGQLYGSSVDGPGPNLRSDLDILVISALEGSRENEAKAIFNSAIEIAESRFHIGAEPKLFSRGVPDEDVDPLYAQHIVDVSDRHPKWRVNNPAQEFEKHLLAPDDWWGHAFHALRYLVNKAYYFDETVDYYAGGADYDAMQRALELPSAIGRKILPATRLPGEELPPISDKAAMRALVEERITKLFDRAEAQQLLEDQQRLTALDAEFTKLLEGALVSQTVSVAEYKDWIEEHYPEACERAQRLSRGWALRLEEIMAKRAPERMHELDYLERGNPYGSS